MKKSVASRLALVSAAAVFIAACSTTTDSPVAPLDKAPSLALGTPGVTVAAVVQVCVDPTSPAVGYSFATVGSNLQAGDTPTTPVGIDTSVPGPICAIVLQRIPTGANGVFGRADITASLTNPVAGTWSWVCVSEDGTGVGCPLGTPGVPGTTTGTGPASAGGENSGHGTTVTFKFTPDLVVGTGCTYTQGRWKNKNKTTTAQYDFDGGTNNGLTVLNTPPKGNPYYILAHQYIAAALNVAAGASMDNGGPGTADDVLAAFQAATAYFAAASAASPLPSPYTKSQITALADILDQYNNGLLGPGHCDEVTQ